MTVTHYQTKSEIIRIGDEGTKFVIILRGHVEVMAPSDVYTDE